LSACSIIRTSWHVVLCSYFITNIRLKNKSDGRMIEQVGEREGREMPAQAGKREAERSAQVLRAARVCIVALGYEHVTMRDIAETAGVSTGTVVHYFGDKERVLEAALLGKIQDTGIAFRAALAGAQTARERLERLIEASLPAGDEVR